MVYQFFLLKLTARSYSALTNSSLVYLQSTLLSSSHSCICQLFNHLKMENPVKYLAKKTTIKLAGLISYVSSMLKVKHWSFD